MDPVWRASIGAPDECPYGMLIDDLPEAVIVSSRPARRASICASCPNDDCGIKHQSACNRAAILKRENFHCPEGQF